MRLSGWTLIFPSQKSHSDRLRGHRIWIYTTSCRSEKYISRLFHAYGLNLDGIVNLDRHNLKTPPCSKYPPAFGIDLLIDDSPGVEQEGRTHGFSVIIVSPDNPDWAEKLLDEIDHLTFTVCPNRRKRRFCSNSSSSPD